MTFEFEGRTIVADPGESTLDALLRSGEAIEHGCKAGACQSCLLRSLDGGAPSGSTQSLDESVAAQGGFLACKAAAGSVTRIERLDPDALPSVQALLVARRMLSSDVAEFRFAAELSVKPGQFVRLLGHPGLSRCYSIASVDEDELSLQVRLIPGGQMSSKLSAMKIGDVLTMRGPFGRCFYRPKYRTRPLLLLATGTGLAPVYGVLQTALEAGHEGPIRLYHGAACSEGLYLREELAALSARYPDFAYVPCADAPTDPRDRTGSPLDLGLADLGDLEGFGVYLCGHPEMVRAGQKRCFLAGANLEDLFADPFEEQSS